MAPPPFDHNEEEEDFLSLQLFTGNGSTRPLQQQSPLQTSTPTNPSPTSMENHTPSPQSFNLFSATIHEASSSTVADHSISSRARRSSTQILRNGKTENIPAPYPWATTKRALVHSLHYLLSKGINTIIGEVQCKRCDEKYEIEYNLIQKFEEVARYVTQERSGMHDRAPSNWMTPRLPDCKRCGQTNCVKPLMGKKREINWLFLLLGQLLGVCKLSELKYFCKHTRNHRTGAKDRVLYLTYLGLLKQLEPKGPFDVA